MKSQLSWDRFYIGIAGRFAELSYDLKTRVGCVIVRDGNILSFSYNGTPEGSSNVMRDNEGGTLSNVLHAETNALAKMAKQGIPTLGATLYSTRAPCIDCAKMIYQCGITRVIYATPHSNDHGTNFLTDNNVSNFRVK